MKKVMILFSIVLSSIFNSSCFSYTAQDESAITMEEVHKLPPLTIKDVISAIDTVSDRYPEVSMNSRLFSRLLFADLTDRFRQKVSMGACYDCSIG